MMNEWDLNAINNIINKPEPKKKKFKDIPDEEIKRTIEFIKSHDFAKCRCAKCTRIRSIVTSKATDTDPFYGNSKVVYKAIKNLLVNEYGLDKKTLSELVATTTKTDIQKIVADYFQQNTLNEFIKREVANQLKVNWHSSAPDLKKLINDLIAAEVKNAVVNKLVNQIEFNVKAVERPKHGERDLDFDED